MPKEDFKNSNLQPMRKFQGFRQTIFWKMFVVQDFFFLKFTNKIP